MSVLKFKKSNLIDISQYIAIVMVILSSGSMYFTILNVRMTLYLLLAVSGVTALVCGIKRRTFYRNIFTFAVVLGFVALNLIFNLDYAVFDNDIFILLIRLVSLVLIQSSITEENFMKKYVKVMYFLAVLSLLCFGYSMLVDYHLPFLIEENRNGIRYYYTFYHTVGYRMIYNRNAGIFWEAPAYAIFIDIALLFLICRQDLFTNKKAAIKYFAVFVVTIITTLSVYAFVNLGIILVLMFVKSRRTLKSTGSTEEMNRQNRQQKKFRQWYVLGVILACIALIYVESKYQIITHKLINRKGSYSTRFNDTYYSLLLAFKRPFTGYGIFNNYTVNALKQFGIGNNSNGLAILLMAVGFPGLLIAGYAVARNLKKMLKLTYLELALAGAAFFLFHFSEHLWLFTLFISFLFSWSTSQGRQNNGGRLNGYIKKTSGYSN